MYVGRLPRLTVYSKVSEAYARKKKKNIQFIIIKQIEYVQKLFELVKSFPSINHILTIIMVICQGRFFLRGIVV